MSFLKGIRPKTYSLSRREHRLTVKPVQTGLVGIGARVTAEQKTGFAFYEKVATDAGGNIAFTFIGSGIIWVCSRVWLGAAKVLFWGAAALMALSLAHFLFVSAAGAIAWAIKAPLPAGQPSWKWLWAGTAARIVEQVLCLTALWLAARAVGYLR